MIHIRRDGDIGRIVLDRPEKRNALTLEMWETMPGLVAELELDAAIKLIMVQGVDPSAFAAGADITEFESTFATEVGRGRYSDAVHAAEQSLGNCAKPTIAMIRGDCIGGGVELALACDLRFASAESRFGITPAKLGLVYSLTSTRRLVELMGPAKAKDLLFTGRLFDAAEAARIGLVDRVFPAARVEAETLAYAESICAVSQYSVRAAKTIVGAILAGAAGETEASRALRVDGFAGEDAREGIRAYLESRKPKFTWSGGDREPS